MLFKADLRQKILEGIKTQTRRPIKSGEWLKFDDQVIRNGRLKWQVGREYAVQYGRGKPMCWWRKDPLGYPIELTHEIVELKKDKYGDNWKSVIAANYEPFKIEILCIRREDVRDISDADVIAEGFNFRSEFMDVWESFYKDQCYEAWVLEFKVAELCSR